MALQRIAGSCRDGTCPTVYATDHGTVVVQGYARDPSAEVSLAPGEALVEVPASLLLEAARQVSADDRA